MLAFRRAHPALRPAEYLRRQRPQRQRLKDVTWFRDDGNEPDGGYFNARTATSSATGSTGPSSATRPGSIYVGYNGWQDPVNVTLPAPSAGHSWFRVGDTAAWMENEGNFRDAGKEDKLNDRVYQMDRRSVLVLIEK